MKLFVIAYEDDGVLARGVFHGLQPLERNKNKIYSSSI